MCEEQKVRHEVEWRDCCYLHAVTFSVIYYSTHTHGKCNLFDLYNKNSNGLLKDFLGHEKRKTSLLPWI